MQIAIFVVGAWLAAQPAEPLVDRDRIAVLIKQLDDDDFRSRDRAMRELRQIGCAALELLNAAKGSVEVREQAERLAREIRVDSFRPGKPAAGMQATLRADSDVFRADSPIAMHLEIKNLGEVSLDLPSTMIWGYYQTYGPESYKVRGLFIPSHANVIVHQLSGHKGAKNLSPYACGPVGTPNPTAVRSGNSLNYLVPVTMVDRLLPGEYEVHVIFNTYHVVKNSTQSALVSNTVRFTVE